MVDQNKKTEAIAELKGGIPAKEIAKKYGVSYNTVLSWKQRGSKKPVSRNASAPQSFGVGPSQNLVRVAGAINTLREFKLI